MRLFHDGRHVSAVARCQGCGQLDRITKTGTCEQCNKRKYGRAGYVKRRTSSTRKTQAR